MKRSRREFIKDCAGATAAIAVAGGIFGCSKADSKAKSVFTKKQRDCFVAIMERFIPADEYCGGATEAGCINFLENWASRYKPEQKDAFAKTADNVDSVCESLFSKSFANLSVDKQNDFLRKWERGKIQFPKNFNASAAFNNLLNVAMMGFYGSPRHGGNKDYMSYKMMGLDVPLLIGQNRYETSGSM